MILALPMKTSNLAKLILVPMQSSTPHKTEGLQEHAKAVLAWSLWSYFWISLD